MKVKIILIAAGARGTMPKQIKAYISALRILGILGGAETYHLIGT